MITSSCLKVARYLKLPRVIHGRGNEISYDEIQFSLLTMQMHFTFTALALPYLVEILAEIRGVLGFGLPVLFLKVLALTSPLVPFPG